MRASAASARSSAVRGTAWRRLFVIVLSGAAALALAVAVRAETLVRHDAAGRAITFDVRTAAVDVGWYAAVLSSAAHGDEIAKVTVRIVPSAQIELYCGGRAVACYRHAADGSIITVGAGASFDVAAALLHEYGHHLDAAWAVEGRSELNGTPTWWAARGIGGLLGANAVAFDYSLGWSHSIGEIFAEDYAYLHLGAGYGIPWLSAPDDALKAALLAEWNATISPPPAMRPASAAAPATAVVATRSGMLAGGARKALGFDPSGDAWSAAVTATVSAVRAASSAALAITCNGVVVARTTITSRRSVTLDAAGGGASRCSAALISMTSSRQSYALRVRFGATTSG